MGGYYEDPKQTSEAVTSEGWFKTGGIDEWDKNAHLKLIDRKKNPRQDTQRGIYCDWKGR